MTAIESLEHCKQLRWSNYHPLGQEQRLSALIGIYEIPKITMLSDSYFFITIKDELYDVALKDGRLYYRLLHRSIDNIFNETLYERGQYVLIYGLVFQLGDDLIITPCKFFNFGMEQGSYMISCTSNINIFNLTAIGI